MAALALAAVVDNITLVAALTAVRAVPVIRSRTATEAMTVARALASGGLRVIEATFTTPDVERVIEELSDEPDIIVGAGTVLTERQARSAVSAGARFLVSPVWLPWLPELSEDLGVPCIPGASTPSEVWNASESTAAAVKVFPIARLGGPSYIRDLLSPLPFLRIMATGGADLAMARELIDEGCIAVGLGSIHTTESLGDSVRSRAAFTLAALRGIPASDVTP